MDAIATWVDSLYGVCSLRSRERIVVFCKESLPNIVEEFASQSNSIKPFLTMSLQARENWERFRLLEIRLLSCLQVLHNIMPHIKAAPLDTSEAFLPSAFDILQDASASDHITSETLEIAFITFNRIIREAILLLRQLKYEVELAESNDEVLHSNPEFNRDQIQQEHLALFKQEFTTVHANDISELRDDPNMKTCHIDLLVRIIESGAYIYTLDEKNAAIQASSKNNLQPVVRTIVNECACIDSV